MTKRTYLDLGLSDGGESLNLRTKEIVMPPRGEAMTPKTEQIATLLAGVDDPRYRNHRATKRLRSIAKASGAEAAEVEATAMVMALQVEKLIAAPSPTDDATTALRWVAANL